MSLFNNFLGSLVPQTSKTSKSTQQDQNSQTDFDFDDAASDGINIGVRVDPLPVRKRRLESRLNSKPKPIDPCDVEGMLMGERVFYELTDLSNEVEEEEGPEAIENPEDQNRDPNTDPCCAYRRCVQKCRKDIYCPGAGAPVCGESEKEASPGPVKKSQYPPCHNRCGAGKRGGGNAETQTSEKPRRQCSDLCRVAKKSQEAQESKPRAPCLSPDPCPPPVCPAEPPEDAENAENAENAEADPEDQDFDACVDVCGENPCASPQPSSPCQARRPVCSCPCVAPCRPRDPCCVICPEEPEAEAAEEAKEKDCEEGEEAEVAAAEEVSAQACTPCPPCPVGAVCPVCPTYSAGQPRSTSPGRPASPTCPASPARPGSPVSIRNGAQACTASNEDGKASPASELKQEPSEDQPKKPEEM